MYCFCFQQELCRQAKIEYAEETRKAQELHNKIKAEIAEAKYNKHYNICWEVSQVKSILFKLTRILQSEMIILTTRSHALEVRLTRSNTALSFNSLSSQIDWSCLCV